MDAPLKDGWLLEKLGGRFQLLTINVDAPETIEVDGIIIERLALDNTESLAQRYLGKNQSAVYLMRPDQHVVARWTDFDAEKVCEALNRSIART